MITISQLAKKFPVQNPKKLSEQEKKDPRLKGRFFHSVQNVSFRCNAGEVLGLLGPNGAGKTSTLRMLSTALTPDSGEIWIDDINILKKPIVARQKIGFLSGTTGLYGRLTGRENITYFGQLHGMSKKAIDDKIQQLADILDLHSFLDRRSENFSTGMKQKTSIARAVVHDPKVVILDEPTTGLDIMAAQTVLTFIRGLKEQGIPVIFSTHHLDEVSELCDKVTVINHGTTQFSDSLDIFRSLAPGSLHQAFMHTLYKEV
ncbi:ATP-binding cassette domain-containing protein [Alteromonas pelagimontana]|uniref:ATP-binding cassette domain-containing protein n=1 Tax=Alteromonas pelagimontana TaxID=1858656 RepID=A0A6M4M9R2_9ALTE|nr:ATP-binding cassette domain-containing protein [Alteromonas pelagimontana]QJR79882.1 ATP-binding cassette domain-containing protein [Alteromonas pelagimontana]